MRIWVATYLVLWAALPNALAQEPSPTPAPSITVVVIGSDDTRAEIRRSLETDSDLPLAVQLAEPPNAPPAAKEADALVSALTETRRRYIEARFEDCLAAAGDLERVHALLGASRRTDAARVLFWRVACHVGAGEIDRANDAAAAFARFELRVPADVDAVTPEVENVLTLALDTAGRGARAPLTIEANAPAAASVDGRERLCATPCTLDVLPGNHVVRVDADGFVPQHRLARVEGSTGARAEFDLQPAPPELAATQWTLRHARAADLESAPALQLLATALRARRLALIQSEPVGETIRLRASLVVEGAVAARGERSATTTDDVEAQTRGLMRDILVSGKLVEPPPKLVDSPYFWVALGAAAVAAAAVTAALVYDPGTTVGVGF